MPPANSISVRRARYQERNIHKGLILVALYFISSVFLALYVPVFALVGPALAVGIAALYFGGYRLLPAIYCAALATQIIVFAPLVSVIIIPFVVVLQAAAGAYAVRALDVDPIFRNKRDALLVTAISCVVALVRPLIELLLYQGPSFADIVGHYFYALTSLVILLPFLLRWFAKSGFQRTVAETVEIVLSLGAVIALACAVFFGPGDLTTEAVFGGLLLIPLFWIALRLRPRFITLALVSILLIASVDTLGGAPHTVLLAQLYLIGLSVGFLVIATQEEERRVNANVMFSQLNSLRNAYAGLSADAEDKKDFVAMLAHELRNPLAPVMSSIELMKLRGARDAEEATMIEVMAERMSAVQQILANMLDISRVWTGKLKLDPKTFDLRLAIEAAILSTQHYRSETHQSLSYKKPDRPIWISGDKVRIEQVFSNLLANASKFSASGSTITIALRALPTSVEIDIADTGMGLRPDEISSIFVPFQQARGGERASAAGLGIGLAIVKSFVELHGGSVSAMSDGEGSGSTFTVRLPLTEAPEVEERQDAPLSGSAKGTASAPLVLIVDDNDAAAAALGRLLQLLNYKVAYAYDGLQAVTMALELSPEAILLDVHLPKLDGHSVAEQLRRDGYPGRIIALSGYAERDMKGKFPGISPFDHYVVKPASIEELRPILPNF